MIHRDLKVEICRPVTNVISMTTSVECSALAYIIAQRNVLERPVLLANCQQLFGNDDFTFAKSLLWELSTVGLGKQTARKDCIGRTMMEAMLSDMLLALDKHEAAGKALSKSVSCSSNSLQKILGLQPSSAYSNRCLEALASNIAAQTEVISALSDKIDRQPQTVSESPSTATTAPTLIAPSYSSIAANAANPAHPLHVVSPKPQQFAVRLPPPNKPQLDPATHATLLVGGLQDISRLQALLAGLAGEPVHILDARRMGKVTQGRCPLILVLLANSWHQRVIVLNRERVRELDGFSDEVYVRSDFGTKRPAAPAAAIPPQQKPPTAAAPHAVPDIAGNGHATDATDFVMDSPERQRTEKRERQHEDSPSSMDGATPTSSSGINDKVRLGTGRDELGVGCSDGLNHSDTRGRLQASDIEALRNLFEENARKFKVK